MPLNEHDAANFLSVQLIEFERRSAARIRTRISCECGSATYEDLTSGVIGPLHALAVVQWYPGRAPIKDEILT